MDIFCLNGYKGEKIMLKLVKALGFPDATSYEGGYDIICSLEIKVACYEVKCDRYYSATGALYHFAEELKECYENLDGTASYSLQLENDLTFKVRMMKSGHAMVIGAFQERPDKENVFTFEMETDQTSFLSVIQGIESLKDQYGGMNGIS